jgi:ribulose-phosphate 3-epimerase
MSHLVAPSVLSADFNNLERDTEMINNSQADWFHIDVMDGVFVPNISFGFPVIKALNKVATKPLDVHLMIVKPEQYVNQFRDVGASVLTVHYEASPHLHRTLQAIKTAGMKSGVALNPHTPASLLADCIHDIDLVTLMSVNPGFGGQKFIENTYKKIRDLVAMKNKAGTELYIEIDGGVNLENYGKLVSAGANVLVAGSTVFSSNNPTQTIADLKKPVS